METKERNEKLFLPDAEGRCPTIPGFPRHERSLKRTYLAPLPGYEWNPVLSLPRNRPCPCLSGRKFKACCLPKLPKAVPAALAKQYREQMSKPDLVFVNSENADQVVSIAKESKDDDLHGHEAG